MEAYCFKCRTKREVQDPQPVFTEGGKPATRGVCPVCSTTMFRMGRTEAHADLPQPPAGGNVKRSGKLVIVESPAKARTALPADEVEAQLYSLLSLEPMHVDEIRAQTKIPIEKVSAALVMMELKGMVRQVGGMQYVSIRETQSDYQVD